jgi:hypothetical protein
MAETRVPDPQLRRANCLPRADFSARVSGRATRRLSARRQRPRVAGITANIDMAFHGVHVA